MISFWPVSVQVARSSGRAKPRVLLVDDHRHILDAVAASLTEDFDIAAVATDGLEAVETASRVNPDVIVLDVSMPGIDGFQTFRALENAGSQTPVVFLSMYDADVYVSEAFRCGGSGFVLKSQVARDLASALEQAVKNIPEIIQCHAVGGGIDYILQIVALSISHYQDIMDDLLSREIGISVYFTYVVTKIVKRYEGYPLAELLGEEARKT